MKFAVDARDEADAKPPVVEFAAKTPTEAATGKRVRRATKARN
jgi:hypothetical protein